MSRRLRKIVFICLSLIPVLANTQPSALTSELKVVFQDDNSFSEQERQHIEALIRQTEDAVRDLLPELPDSIQVSVHAMDRDVASVGGVTGRADNPNTVVLYISTSYESGVIAASNTGLAPALYHEFHHLVRGWTIEGNKFGPGITTAAVNEGLANVFSEIYTNTAFVGNAYPTNVRQWWAEIEALPSNADYGQWMVQHDDGREAIGYKAGSFIVREAMAASGLTILELSTMAVEDILDLAGDNL